MLHSLRGMVPGWGELPEWGELPRRHRLPQRNRPIGLLLLSLLLTGISTPSPTEAQAVMGVGSDAELRLGAIIQPAYRYQGLEGAEDLTGFFLRRARIDLSGHILEGRVRFRLLPDLAGNPMARDAWIEMDAPLGLNFRLGQQVVPFNLQRERSMARSHFGDRALASSHFELSGGRDIGGTLGWSASSGRASFTAGIFNGKGMNRREPSPAPLLSYRGSLSFGGPASGSETDLARSPTPVATLSLGGMSARRSSLRPRPGFAADQRTDWWNVTSDLHLRYRGFSLVAAWFEQWVSPEADPVPPNIRGGGGHLGAGWVLPGRGVELAIQYSEAEWDRDRDGGPAREGGVGVTFFHREHELQTRIQLTHLRTAPLSVLPSATVLTVEHQLLLGG